MIGNKTPKEIKAEIRAAFADKGVDVETWLDQQMAKLQKAPRHAEEGVFESLKLIARALRREVAKKKARKPKSMARTKR